MLHRSERLPQAGGGLRGALRGSDVDPRLDPASFAAAARIEVDLIGKLRRLPRHVGVGPDGVANEPLLAVLRLDRRGHWSGPAGRCRGPCA